MFLIAELFYCYVVIWFSHGDKKNQLKMAATETRSYVAFVPARDMALHKKLTKNSLTK